MSLPLTWVWDEAGLKYLARVKTILANTGQREMPPWIKMLCPVGSNPNAPAFLKLPDEAIAPLTALYETIGELCDGKVWTLEQTISKVAKEAEGLKDNHFSFALDLAFLKQKAMQLLKTRIYEDVMQCLAKKHPDSELDYDVALRSLRSVRAGERVVAATDEIRDEITGIVAVVKNVGEYASPKCTDVAKLGAFTKQVLASLVSSFFVHFSVVAAGKTKATKVTVRGVDAVKRIYEDISKRMKADSTTVAMLDIKPLQRYCWLLTIAQNDMVKTWIQTIAKHEVGLKLKSCLADKEPVADGAIVVVKKASSSASSSSTAAAIAAVVPSPCAKGSKKDGAKVSKATQNLDRFFKK